MEFQDKPFDNEKIDILYVTISQHYSAQPERGFKLDDSMSCKIVKTEH